MAAHDAGGSSGDRELGIVTGLARDDLAFGNHAEPVRPQPQRFNWVARVEHHKRGLGADGQAIVSQVHDAGAFAGGHVKL